MFPARRAWRWLQRLFGDWLIEFVKRRSNPSIWSRPYSWFHRQRDDNSRKPDRKKRNNSDTKRPACDNECTSKAVPEGSCWLHCPRRNYPTRCSGDSRFLCCLSSRPKWVAAEATKETGSDPTRHSLNSSGGWHCNILSVISSQNSGPSSSAIFTCSSFHLVKDQSASAATKTVATCWMPGKSGRCARSKSYDTGKSETAAATASLFLKVKVNHIRHACCFTVWQPQTHA